VRPRGQHSGALADANSAETAGNHAFAAVCESEDEDPREDALSESATNLDASKVGRAPATPSRKGHRRYGKATAISHPSGKVSRYIDTVR
jgi:hypothetical protein